MSDIDVILDFKKLEKMTKNHILLYLTSAETLAI